MSLLRKAHIFPPPSFITMPSIGFDISDRSIKYIGLKEGKNGLMLDTYGKIALPKGLVVSGKIADIDGLRALVKEMHKTIKRNFVRVSLPEEQVYIFNVTIPSMKSSDVRNAIMLQLEDHVPIATIDAVFDYDLFIQTDTEMTFQVAVISQAVIDSYFTLFEGTGFTPLSFELEAQSIARAIVPQEDKRAFMVIDFGETRTGISVVYKGLVLFTSTIDVGGHNLTEAVMKYFSLSEREALIKKEKFGLHSGAIDTGVFPAVLNLLSTLKDEVNKHYVYWHKYPFEDGTTRPKIESILLCGGEANLIGLDDYLSASLSLRVERANPWINTNSLEKYIPEMSYKESLANVTTLGLALGDFTND